MAFRNTIAAAVSVLAVVGASAWVGDADACIAIPCRPLRVAPAAGSTIPGNALAFPVLVPEDDSRAAGPLALRLLDPLGRELSASVTSDPSWPSGNLLVAAAALAPGAGYQIAYDETCDFSPPPPPVFDVGPAAPLLKTIDSVKGANWSVGHDGSCGPAIDYVMIDLHIPASPEAIAWAPLTTYRIEIDGQKTSQSYYGVASRIDDSLRVGHIQASCHSTSTPGEWTLGVHDITVKAHVAGAASDPPPVSVRLRLSCTDSNFDQIDPLNVGAEGDSGVPANGFGANNGITNASNPKTDETVVAGCGCSTIGARGVGTSLVGFSVTALAIAALARRRRRASTPSASRRRGA